MVIAFDAKRVFHNFTGLGNYSRTLLKNLATYYPEHEYHLFTPSIKENAETNYFLNNPQFIIHTPLKNKIGWRLLHMGGHVNTLNPDIFHGLSHELPVGLNTYTIKSVVTFHDLIYEI